MRLRKGFVALILPPILINLSGCLSFESDVFARTRMPEPAVIETATIVAQSTDQPAIEP